MDRELKRDRTRGALQGIPYGAKDLLAVKKKPTTWGAKPYAAQVFDYDAHVIEKTRQSRSDSDRQALHGGTGWGRRLSNRGCVPHWSGAESLGSYAMERRVLERSWCGRRCRAGNLRDRLGDFRLDSDAVRLLRRYWLAPDVWSGQPARRHGALVDSRQAGPMCRSAEDCALVLHEIAGVDTDDSGSAGRSFNYTPQYTTRRLPEITIGYMPVDFQDGAEAAAQPAFQAAFEVVKSLGVKMKEIQLPDFPYGALVGAIIAGEAGSIFEDFIRSGKVDQLADPHQIAGLKAMLDMPATEYLRAMRVRSLVKAAFHDLFLNCDMVLAPTRLGPADKVAEPLDTPGPPTKSRGGLIPGGNLAGLPAMSLPCGFADGLPLGISLLGRPFYENQLIAIGNLFQKQTDWHRRRPPVEA